MIALGVRYLTGYAVATNLARQQPEWPPHWGRAFMAMAAGYFEGGENAAERQALEWLEGAPAPALYASDADDRSTVRAYVPVNDDHGGIIGRIRQDRAFPRTRPHEDCVYFIWNCEAPVEVRPALESLCRKVTRIGHSMSAVQMWVAAASTPEANWIPDDAFQDMRMRVAGIGTLRLLEQAFNSKSIQEYEALTEALNEAKGRQKAALKNDLKTKFPEGAPMSRRPLLVNWQAYGRQRAPDAELPELAGPFDEDFIVLTKFEGMTLGLESTLQLTGALRDAAMAASKHPPEWLSGHDDAGSPSLENHAAFFPLAYTDFDHADGHVMGLGIALPRGMRHSPELRGALGPLFFDPATGEERPVKLWRNREGRPVWRWELQRETRERPPITLQRSSWTGPSREWASVTPVVLHHYPKKREGDLERIVRAAFRSALLPEPEEVRIRAVSGVKGAGHAMAMPPFTEGGPKLCQYQTHVTAKFPQPVRGPMLVGRGRFRGYGLFAPVREGRS